MLRDLDQLPRRDRSRLAFDGVDVLLMLAWWSLVGIVLHLVGAFDLDPLSPWHRVVLWLFGIGIAMPFARRAIFGGPVRTVRRRASVLGITGLLLVTLGFLTALSGGWVVVRRPDPPPSQAELDAGCKPGTLSYMAVLTGDQKVDAAREASAIEQARQDCLASARGAYADYLRQFRQSRFTGVYILLGGTFIVLVGCLLDRARMRREQLAS